MTQNLISLNVPLSDMAAITAALDILEEKLAGMIELSVDDRRSLNKMGDKSEVFCRQTLLVLAQNRQIVPPGLDLAAGQDDLRNLDQLRPVFARLRALAGRADDTEMALGSDILSLALEGYAVARAFGKGSGLDALRDASEARFGRKRKSVETPAR